MRVAGHDVARDPDAVRAAIGVTGQFSAVDNLLTGEENLLLMADLHHLGRREGRRRAAELLERFDLVDAADEDRRHLLRRHAAPARPGDDAWSATRASSSSTSRPPASTRAAAAPCGRSSATSWPTASRSSSPRSTWRRPTSSPTGSRCSTTAGWSPRAPPDELKRLRPRRPHPPALRRRRRARRGRPRPRRGRPRRRRRSTLQVPSDGSVRVAAAPARPARRRIDRGRRAVGPHPRSRRRVPRPHRPPRPARGEPVR